MSPRASGTYVELDDAWDDPGWSRVPNSIARCPTVSRRFKGWVLEVASHEKGRRLTFKDMVACSTDGRDATYAAIKEGLDAGFVTRHQERDESGRMGIVVYRLHVTPQNPRSGPLPEKPDTVRPDTVKPETSKKTRTSKDKEPKDLKDLVNAAASTPTDDQPTDLFGATPAAVPAGVQPRMNGHVRTGPGRGVAPPSEGDSRATTAGSTPAVLPGPSRAELAAVHAALFEEFWTIYAHKVGKGAARKAWTVACRQADPREVINAAARYAASRRGEDPRFTPHASTWLNGERWLDEPEYVRNGSGPPRDGRSNGHVAYQNPPESAYVRTKPRHHTSDQQGGT